MPPKGSKKRKVEEQAPPPPVANKRASLSSFSIGPSQRLVEKARAVSQPEIVELSYEYTIPDLSLVPQKPGECVSSSVFHAKSHKNIAWKLKIYPNGILEDSQGHLSINLRRSFLRDQDKTPSAAKSVGACYKISLLKNGKEIVSKMADDYSCSSNNFGWSKFLSLDQLIGVNNAELKIVCSLVFEADRITTTCPVRIAENASLLSQQRVMELNYDWVIEEPIFLPQKNGESFYSPIFSAKASNKIRWRLKICPRGANEESKGHLSLYLERVVDGEKIPSVTVKSKWVVSKNDKEIFSKTDELQTLGPAPLLKHFGWDKLVPLETIKRASIFENDDVDELKISCQLIYTI